MVWFYMVAGMKDADIKYPVASLAFLEKSNLTMVIKVTFLYI